MFFKKNEDEALMHILKSEDAIRQSAENKLFEKYYYFINQGIHKFSLSEDDAFNAYSDTLLTVLEHIKEGLFQGKSSLKTYLYQIFSNKCVDIFRKNSTKKASAQFGLDIEDFAHNISAESKNILQQMIDSYDIEKLYEKLKKIGANCQEILLFWGEGYSDKFISEHLKYNNAAVVKTTRNRCLEKLKKTYLNNSDE